MKRTKILFVAHSSVLGGAEYCLDTTLEHLDRARFDPVVVFPSEGPMSAAARRRGVPAEVVPLIYWLYFRRSAWYWRNLAGRLVPNVWRLVRLIRCRRVELVYTNTAAIFEGALAARLAGVPHVWHVHEVLRTGEQMEELLGLDTMKRLIVRASDRVVFESDAARRAFEATVVSPRSVVVPNCLRLRPEFEAEPMAASRARFGLEPDDEVVGFVGQFIDRKNPMLLVDAMARLGDRPHLRALFVGDGPLRSRLEAVIADRGLVDRCHIVPFQSDVEPVMRALDVLVLPSRAESFGLVLLEAAAYGRPAVACACEGPEEIVEPGRTGLIVPQDDAGALAAAIASCFDGSRDRSAMGAAAQDRVRKNYDPVRIARRLERVLIETIEAPHRPRRGIFASRQHKKTASSEEYTLHA